MHRGYIKLWRKMFDSGIHKDHATFALWIWILCNVTRKPLNYITRGQQIRLEPGELIIGRRKISIELRLGEQSVRSALKKLKNWKNLTIRSTNRYSIIKVVNWEIYQENDFDTNQQTVTQLTSKPPTEPPQTPTKQEVKKLRRKENNISSDFEVFWSTYPKKVGKLKALEAWNKQNGQRPVIDSIVSKIEELKKSDQWNREGGQYIPNPATWINQGRWFDECKIAVSPRRAPTWEDHENTKP